MATPNDSNAVDDLQLSPFQHRVELLIKRQPSPEKHCARSAIRYMRKAWRLRSIDKEMTVFCLITGEEEAATAIMKAIARRGYAGADCLDAHNHTHKNSIVPFIDAVQESFLKKPLVKEWEVTVFINPKIPIVDQAVSLRIRFPELGGVCGTPAGAPLDFSYTQDGVNCSFEQEIASVLGATKPKKVLQLFHDRANERNEVLYASPQGLRNYDHPNWDAHIAERTNRVFTLLSIFLMISQHKVQQSFVQHCLDELLKALRRIR